MMARELKRLGVDIVDRDYLQRAIKEFDAAVSGAKSARDILEHFDEYARGEGKLVVRFRTAMGAGLIGRGSWRLLVG